GVAVRSPGFQAVAGAVDGEALLVEQFADAADQQHFMVLVIAAVAPALDRLQLGELLLPVAQHVRLHAAQFAHLANREITLGGNRRQCREPGLAGAIVHLAPQAGRTLDLVVANSTMLLSFWLAWKVTTRRAVIGISSPVFGLRPGRCGLSRNW